jgi:hypothetical protein
MATWSDSDAWVFSSIGGTGPDDGYRLSEIIAKADCINHAILIEAEFTRAVPRLLAAGLIGANVQAGRYWLTEAGRALYQQRMKRRGLFGWMEAIPPALGRLGEPQDSAWSLPAGAFDEAVREHLKRANQILKRLGIHPIQYPPEL